LVQGDTADSLGLLVASRHICCEAALKGVVCRVKIRG
jgi:hypothetical protein